MANHKATLKGMRQNAKRNVRNRYYGKTARNALRKLMGMTDKEEINKTFPVVMSMIDKLARRGVIHKNKAGNLKSKAARNINKLTKQV